MTGRHDGQGASPLEATSTPVPCTDVCMPIHTLRFYFGVALVSILAMVTLSLSLAYAARPRDSDLAMVTGRVTLAGSNVSGMMICCDLDGRHSLYGVVLDDGTFKLVQWFRTRAGVPPGRYRAHLSTLFAGGPQVPSKYTDPATSQIEIDIASGRSDLLIALQ